jgi:DNA primase
LDAKELRKYIYEKDIIEDIAEKIGCHKFHSYGKEIRCALPDDNDGSKVSIFINEFLNVRIFNKGETIKGNIYNLIMYIDHCDFPTALHKCAALCGVDISYNHQNKNSYLNIFNKIKRKQKDKDELPMYDMSILDKYSSVPHIDLIKRDGLFQNVIDKYNIKFDIESNRIVFPHFAWNDETKVVGLVGRTVNHAYEELNIPKYFPVDGYKYEKSKNLYGLSLNKEDIKKQGFVLVYEAEKSVYKSDMMGFPNAVSVGCHDISDFQLKLLIKLNVEIVIAFDNDVESEYLQSLCKKISMFRTCSYINDRWKLLGEKDSPVDCGRRKFIYLLKHRERI